MREKIFPGIFGRLVSRTRAVKRKFSDCQHTSSDRALRDEIQFSNNDHRPALVGHRDRAPPLLRKAITLARARARARIIEYDDI